MAHKPWAPVQHSPLIQIDDNLWAVEDTLGPVHRRMCIIKRSDGSLLFFHAVPVDDATLAAIKSLGEPKYLVVGHHQHAVHAHAFQEKLGLKAYGPKKVSKDMNKRFRLDGGLEDIPTDPTMDCVAVPGSRFDETAIVVRSGGGSRTSILFSDVIQNNPKESLLLPFRLLGFGGGPKVVPMYRLLFTSDKKLTKEALEAWAQLPGLTRLVPFHGTITDTDPAAALRTAAKVM